MFKLFKKPTTHKILSSNNIDNYIKEIVIPRLNLSENSSLQIDEIKVGSNTKLFQLSKSETEKLIIKFYPVKGGKSKGTEHNFLTNLLLDNNIDVPKILLFDSSRKTIEKYNFEVVIEEFINGKHISMNDLKISNISNQISNILKKLHQLRSPILGKPWGNEVIKGRATDFFYEQIKTHFKIINKYLKKLANNQIDEYFSFFSQRSKSISNISNFDLTHNDISPENIMINSDGKIYLIDFGSMSYFFLENDLISVWLKLCEKDENLFNEFLEMYFRDETASNNFQRFQSNRQFFISYYFLQKSSSNTQKSIRVKRKSKQELEIFHKQAENFWNQFLESIKY